MLLGSRSALKGTDSYSADRMSVAMAMESSGLIANLLLGVVNMNPVDNVGGNNPIYTLTNQPVRKQVPAQNTTAPSGDRVELSGVGKLMQALKSNDIRADKVAAIKAQIAAGTYESDDKLNAAVDRLLEDLAE